MSISAYIRLIRQSLLHRGGLALLLIAASGYESRLHADEICQAPLQSGLVELASHQLDAALESIAGSNQAIAGEWLEAYRLTGHADSIAASLDFRQIDGVTLFPSWRGAAEPLPAYRSDHTAWYSYSTSGQTGTQVQRQIEIFRKMAPVLRVVNRTLGLTWTYITTHDNWMMLYPFLTPDEAKNNQVPSEQVFYTAADFGNRKVGWTPPYLDLAGAGMMVTASFPVYDQDELLGVVSQDITLNQLSSGLLHSIAGDPCIAWLVDSAGMAIASSDPELEKEIEQANSAPSANVLYYLDEPRLESLENKHAVVSKFNWINQATSALLNASVENNPAVVTTTSEDKPVIASRVHQSDWWLILTRR